MQSDPLQQLRDVHLPPDPSWWPPAIGWWILAAFAIALLAWLILKAISAYRRRAPLRAAKTLLHDLLSAYNAGQITAVEYLHAGNELLKRVLVRGYGRSEYAPLAGAAWLTALDQLSGTDHFSNGTGSILGELRFSENPAVDVPELHREIERVLAKVKP